MPGPFFLINVIIFLLFVFLSFYHPPISYLVSFLFYQRFSPLVGIQVHFLGKHNNLHIRCSFDVVCGGAFMDGTVMLDVEALLSIFNGNALYARRVFQADIDVGINLLAYPGGDKA